MLDSPPLVRSPVRTGSSLLVCDVVLVGSFTLPRSPAQADVVVFAMKVSSFGLASSVHSFVQMDVSLLAPASVKAGLFTMTRSFGRVGLAASVLELSHLDPASPLQSFARSEASACPSAWRLRVSPQRFQISLSSKSPCLPKVSLDQSFLCFFRASLALVHPCSCDATCA